MELKEYQQRALATVEKYLKELRAWRDKVQTVPKDVRMAIDFPMQAWPSDVNGVYQSKKTGAGDPLPNFCLKVPTGGGKTYLAVQTIDRIQSLYLERPTGMVLWVVPTDQIYRQTLSYLKDRAHPYRQFLDIATGGRVMVVEKTDRFTLQDIQERLVILLLMLPSANRRDKETLKMFQDAGGFEAFFPEEGHRDAHDRLLQRWPNLDYFGSEQEWYGRQVKTSLGNVLRILSPVIILDEGQKAYSEGAQATIRGFNPSLLVELSATPPRGSNILVNIRGRELDQEEMIKLDLHVTNRSSTNWKDTLADSVAWRDALEEEAVAYESRTGVYIRPICLIQVERTGQDQVEAGYIHAEHVKEALAEIYNVPVDQIAIKSSVQDDIEGIDLLSRDCPVRYIITKQALQEGWDCPFAYVLSILTNPSSQTALTQLVGRILRQPYAKKTGVRALDESYVFCFHRKAAELSKAIKDGLEDEGLGDLAHSVEISEGDAAGTAPIRTVGIREKFKRFEGKVYLPKFFIREGGREEEISYEMDVVQRIRWSDLTLDRIRSLTLKKRQLVDWEESFGYAEEGDTVITREEATYLATAAINPLFLTRRIERLVPNPWVAREIVERALEILRERYCEEVVAANQVLIAEELEKTVEAERDALGEEIFRDLIDNDQLRLVLMSGKAYQVPSRITIPQVVQQPLLHDTGKAVQMSLFDDPVPGDWFNGTLEAPVALCLDSQEKLLFWYRNLVGMDYFSVQGWRKNRIWPDFIAAKRSEAHPEEYGTIYVLETKGDQLAGNLDTQYKQQIFALCNELGKKITWAELGLEFPNRQVQFQVVMADEWERVIQELFS